jgi:hypothetical protein
MSFFAHSFHSDACAFNQGVLYYWLRFFDTIIPLSRFPRPDPSCMTSITSPLSNASVLALVSGYSLTFMYSLPASGPYNLMDSLSLITGARLPHTSYLYT